MKELRVDTEHSHFECLDHETRIELAEKRIKELETQVRKLTKDLEQTSDVFLLRNKYRTGGG